MNTNRRLEELPEPGRDPIRGPRGWGGQHHQRPATRDTSVVAAVVAAVDGGVGGLRDAVRHDAARLVFGLPTSRCDPPEGDPNRRGRHVGGRADLQQRQPGRFQPHDLPHERAGELARPFRTRALTNQPWDSAAVHRHNVATLTPNADATSTADAILVAASCTAARRRPVSSPAA